MNTYYEWVRDSRNIANGANASIEFKNTQNPFEDLTIWVTPGAAATYTLQPQINGADFGSPVSVVASALTQKIIITGIFPPSAPVNPNAAPLLPSIKISNTGLAPINFGTHMIGRVYGAAV